MHLNVVVALLTEHVDHLANDVLRVLGGPLGDLHHRLLAVFAALQLLLRNQHVVNEDIAFGNEEGIVLLHLQLTHGLIGLVTQYLRHHCLLDVLLAAGHHGHADTVAVEGKHRVALRHEDWRTATIGQERVLAVGLTNERTLLHLSFLVQSVLVVTHLAEVVVPAHLIQSVDGQHLRRMRV